MNTKGVEDGISDEQVVRQIYTDATLVLNIDGNYYIYTRQGAGGRLSAYCATKEEAWESAKDKHATPSEARCYCGLEPIHPISAHKIHPAHNPELDGDDPASMEGSYRPEFANKRAPTTCKYGDKNCPCQDGDPCHYEGDNPMKPMFYDRDKPHRFDPKMFEGRKQLSCVLYGYMEDYQIHKADNPLKDYCTKDCGPGNLCSRDAGHNGPCGPYEDEPTELLKTIRPARLMPKCTCKNMHGHKGCVSLADVSCSCVLHDNDPDYSAAAPVTPTFSYHLAMYLTRNGADAPHMQAEINRFLYDGKWKTTQGKR